jgi:restriction system protein
MSAIKACYAVLKEAGKPLLIKDLTRLIIEKGLWHPTGLTPENSVGAPIYEDIKKRGKNSLFVQTGPCEFSLREFSLSKFNDNNTSSLLFSNNRQDKISVSLVDSSQPLDSETTEISLPQPERAEINNRNYLTNGRLSIAEAAEKALDTFANKTAMHYRDITLKAIENGWLDTKSKTPEYSLNSILSNEIKKKEKQGQPSIFIKFGKGLYGLRSWKPTHDLFVKIDEANKNVREQLRKKLLNMPSDDFEILISKLLVALGFENVEVTSPSDDRGIDLRGTLLVGESISTKMAVQVKRKQKTLSRLSVQQVRGSLGAHEQGLIISANYFSPDAIEEASQSNTTPISLMNGDQLVSLLMEYQIGVKLENINIFEIDDEFFKELQDE